MPSPSCCLRFVPTLFGMAARVAHPGITDANLVLPTVLLEQLPVWLGALALAAVFSTEVDTCDAVLFMVSTTLSKDVYKRHINPDASDQHLLLVARVTAVAAGALGVVLSIYLGTVTQALTIFYALLGVTFFVPVLGGLFVHRAGPSRGARRHCGRRDHVARRRVRIARASPLARSHDDRHFGAAVVVLRHA